MMTDHHTFFVVGTGPIEAATFLAREDQPRMWTRDEELAERFATFAAAHERIKADGLLECAPIAVDLRAPAPVWE